MKVTIETIYISIAIDQTDGDEAFLAINKLAGRYYNSAKQVWIIPIRLGISDLLHEHEVFWQLEPLVRPTEEALFQQAQLEGQSLDIWSIPAYYGLAQAALGHLQTVHLGNVTVYNENHPNYKEIQNENSYQNRRKENQVRSAANAKTKASDKGKRKGNKSGGGKTSLLDR